MAALKAVEILPKNLKSYNQLPDYLVSLPCATEYSGNKKYWTFSPLLSFLIHF